MKRREVAERSRSVSPSASKRTEHLARPGRLLELERRPHTRQGVAVERLTDPGEQRIAHATEITADDHRRRAEDVQRPASTRPISNPAS